MISNESLQSSKKKRGEKNIAKSDRKESKGGGGNEGTADRIGTFI